MEPGLLIFIALVFVTFVLIALQKAKQRQFANPYEEEAYYDERGRAFARHDLNAERRSYYRKPLSMSQGIKRALRGPKF